MFGFNKLRRDTADILADHKKAIEHLMKENRDIREAMLKMAKISDKIVDILTEMKIKDMVDSVPEEIKEILKKELENMIDDDDEDYNTLTSSMIKENIDLFKKRGIKLSDSQVTSYPNFKELLEAGVLDESIQALIDNGIVEDCGDPECSIHGIKATKKRKANLAKNKKK